MKKVTNKEFIAKATEIALEHGFDDPENAFWQCNVFSQAVLQAAYDYDIEDLTLILVEAEYQANVGDVDAGYTGGHVLVKLGDTYYDWTIRQIDPEAKFPYKSKKLPKYYTYKYRVYSEDVLNDFEYYSKLIKKLEG